MNSLRAPVLLPLLLLAGLGGCGRGEGPAPAPPPVAADEGPRFLSPPQPLSARRAAEEGVEVLGRAAAGARVTLRNPDGEALEALAGADGAWSVTIQPRGEPRLYALSGSSAAGPSRGEGALVIAPSPGAPALLLRPGAPALSLDEPDGTLAIESVDFDTGGLAVAGHADPRANLRLSLDGRPAAAARADAQGRFALLAVQGDLKPGSHGLRLEDGTRVVEVAIDDSPSQPLQAPYAVRRLAAGWRIDWAIPGGGAQSCLLFAPPISAPAR